jgi:regulator of protease activity HflC (stomatin/prohibitin superfamily)
MQAFIEFIISIWDRIIPLAVVAPWEGGVRVRSLPFLRQRVKKVGGGVVFTIPFADEVEMINTKRQVVDLDPQFVQTKDGKQIQLSLTVTYSIQHADKVWTDVQDHDDSLAAEAMNIAAEWVNETDYRDVTIKNLVEACQPQIRTVGFRWGCKVEKIGVNGLAQAKVLRVVIENG